MPGRFRTLSPILWTKDLAGTIRFYENKLGFASQSNFARFASLRRGPVEIMFVEPQEEDFSASWLTGSLFIYMEGVDDFWQTVKNDVTVKSPLEDRDYFMRDFSILDNNGYEIVFGEDISDR